jgi:hypothetical protein
MGQNTGNYKNIWWSQGSIITRYVFSLFVKHVGI